MKKILYLASALFLISCGNNEATEENEGITNEAKTSEVYYFDVENTTVGWTAYKTNDKIPVGGAFDSFEVQNAQESEDILQILKGAAFSVDINSTNTGNADRDGKIKNLFFGTFADEGKINGVFTDISDSTIAFNLKMNGVEKSYEAPLNIDFKSLSFIFNLDLNDFNANAGVAALNEACYDLHKGSDGISKLWSEVAVEISTTFSKK